jgi:2,4-dienoyl-CoA reductase-like NADH-dependent reductase (Old Yellow Enzyme family)
MSHDRPHPRYETLFDPVRIGPVIAPNRFYQTPHATGMGWRMPKASAALRGVKAEGGWGVVPTEYCSIPHRMIFHVPIFRCGTRMMCARSPSRLTPFMHMAA